MGHWKTLTRVGVLTVAVAVGGSSTSAKSAHTGTARGRAGRIVLLTGFRPYAGEPRNNSYEIAKHLKANPSLLGDDVAVEICELPAEYGRGAKVAETCFENARARGVQIDAVVSLGEGRCEVSLETAANNFDNESSADSAGVVRTGQAIDSSLPPRVGFTLAVDRAFRVRPQPPGQTPVRASISTGYYVCNDTAFLLAHYFKAKSVPFGFMHLPPESCAGGHVPPFDPKLVGALIGAAISGSPVNWPVDLASASTMAASGGGKVDREFLNELVKAYGRWRHRWDQSLKR